MIKINRNLLIIIFILLVIIILWLLVLSTREKEMRTDEVRVTPVPTGVLSPTAPVPSATKSIISPTLSPVPTGKLSPMPTVSPMP